VNADVYLLDANVLSRLSAKQRSSPFLQNHCKIPSEVLFEVRGFPDVDRLRALEERLDGEVLESLRQVMGTVPADDFKLVDLYGNKGSADPILVATALTGMRRAAATLFAENWAVVTDDEAVRAKASEFGLAWLSSAEFVQLLPSE
jgi:hypothetical protein